MSRATFLKQTMMGLLASGCLVTAAGERKPNVVIFFTDDQGTLDANCYGSTDLYTPAMDALAETVVRFTQAYAHMVCYPARSMLMTGRYPQRSNVNGQFSNQPCRYCTRGRDRCGDPPLNCSLSA